MICYQDEVMVEVPACSREELQVQIRELEIKNFGHAIDYDQLPHRGPSSLRLELDGGDDKKTQKC